MWMLYVTCRDIAEAETIARTLLDERLIACANILPAMQSLYRWEGAIQSTEETALILKTDATCVHTATNRIRELHTYDVPCIAAWKITHGNSDFMAWVKGQMVNYI